MSNILILEKKIPNFPWPDYHCSWHGYKQINKLVIFSDSIRIKRFNSRKNVVSRLTHVQTQTSLSSAKTGMKTPTTQNPTPKAYKVARVIVEKTLSNKKTASAIHTEQNTIKVIQYK